MALDPIWNYEMSEFMPDDPQCRVAIRDHAGREVNPPNRQVRIGESGPIGMKSGPRLQEFGVLEYHKGYWFLEIKDFAKHPGRRLRDARDESFLRLGASYDGVVCCRSQSRHER